jgi:hypothetical protein
MDMGCGHTLVYEGLEARDCHSIIPQRETPAVKAGKYRPPTCEHGEWTFAGSDAKRQAAKWRCPTALSAPRPAGESRPADCTPSSRADRPLEALPAARCRRAGERPAQEGVGLAGATGAPP